MILFILHNLCHNGEKVVCCRVVNVPVLKDRSINCVFFKTKLCAFPVQARRIKQTRHNYMWDRGRKYGVTPNANERETICQRRDTCLKTKTADSRTFHGKKRDKKGNRTSFLSRRIIQNMVLKRLITKT